MRIVFDSLNCVAVAAVFAVLGVCVLLVRQRVLRGRGAGLHCGLRMDLHTTSRGWRSGVLRYTPHDLEWFRLLSLRFQPQQTFVRRGMAIKDRRDPHGAEQLAVPHGATVVRCDVISRDGAQMDVELALSGAALTGLLAWIESPAPGAHSHPDTRV